MLIYYIFRHIHQSDFEESADGGEPVYSVDDRGTRKFLFKKRSTSSTCAVNMSRNYRGELLVRSQFYNNVLYV